MILCDVQDKTSYEEFEYIFQGIDTSINDKYSKTKTFRQSTMYSLNTKLNVYNWYVEYC